MIAAGLVEFEVLHHRLADAHHRRALFLHRDVGRIERLADVGDRHVAKQLVFTRLAVDGYLGGRHAELVERRVAAERVIGR